MGTKVPLSLLLFYNKWLWLSAIARKPAFKKEMYYSYLTRCGELTVLSLLRNYILKQVGSCSYLEGAGLIKVCSFSRLICNVQIHTDIVYSQCNHGKLMLHLFTKTVSTEKYLLIPPEIQWAHNFPFELKTLPLKSKSPTPEKLWTHLPLTHTTRIFIFLTWGGQVYSIQVPRQHNFQMWGTECYKCAWHSPLRILLLFFFWIPIDPYVMEKRKGRCWVL